MEDSAWPKNNFLGEGFMKRRLFLWVFLCVSLVFSASVWAIYTNGGFETGDFTGWTKGHGLNNGLTLPQPFTEASIVIDPGGLEIVSVAGAGATDPRTDNLLVLPRAGGFTAKVNDEGGSNHLNFISQQDVITEADRDPVDGKLHVRFSFAVVLEDPGHNPEEQPFFHVRVRNITKGTTLFDSFAFSNQVGQTWQTSNFGGSTWRWLDWQNQDIVVPDADLNDTIEIRALAADCSLGGHGGYVYLDGFGSAQQAPPPGQQQPTSVPTMSEWGMLVFMLLAGFGSLYFLKRQRKA